MEPNPASPVNPQAPQEHQPLVREQPAEPKSFLASKTVWIALLGLFVAPLLKQWGIAFDDAAQQEVAEILIRILTGVGIVWARAKAKGPLEFGTGVAPVLLLFAAITLLLGGCETLKLPQAKICYTRNVGGTDVTACYDGKTISATVGGAK